MSSKETKCNKVVYLYFSVSTTNNLKLEVNSQSKTNLHNAAVKNSQSSYLFYLALNFKMSINYLSHIPQKIIKLPSEVDCLKLLIKTFLNFSLEKIKVKMVRILG